MIAQLKSSGRKRPVLHYHLRVVLTGTEPLVWRLLQVPGKAKLDWLHAVLQVAMGWTNSHLHQFNVKGKLYSNKSHGMMEYEGGPEVFEESQFTIADVAPREGDSFTYEYDFGDSWEHELMVEKRAPMDTGKVGKAVCLDGARACPPEDCGGVWGYEHLLQVLLDRKHPDHKDMKAWLGRSFDPECFDVAAANRWLRELKWPRVTDNQLRKVLMARDGYKA